MKPRAKINAIANEENMNKANLKAKSYYLLNKCKLKCYKDVMKVESDFCLNKCQEEFLLFENLRRQTRVPELKKYIYIVSPDHYKMVQPMHKTYTYAKYLEDVNQSNILLKERNEKLQMFLEEWGKRIN